MIRRTILGVALVLLCGHAGASEPEQWRVGNWLAGAYRDAGGDFTHCGASARYKSGVILVFSIQRTFQWSVGLVNPAWRLETGQVYPLEMQVDGVPAGRLEATVIGVSHVAAGLPDDAALFQRLRQGAWLTLRAAGQDFQFQLQDSSRMLAGLGDCVTSHVRDRQAARPEGQNPFVPPAKAPPGTVAATAEEQLEGSHVFISLDQAGAFDGAVLLAAREVPEGFRNQAAVWRTADTLGTLHILRPGASASIDAVAAGLIAGDAGRCHGGVFASGALPDEEADLRRVFSGCESIGEGATHVRYIVMDRPGGGFYVLSSYALDRPEPAQAAEERMRAVLVAALRLAADRASR